jgi:teichuronic acid biosynthesis glycosyltransferase TuaG
MNREPHISVVMPVYNSAEYVDEAIFSIRNQTYGNFELIIVDDGSTDDSLEIIRWHEREDQRVRVIALGENRGQAAAKNAALTIAQGSYIALMDSDDVSLPERLRIQYQFLEDNPDVYLIAGSYDFVDKDGQLIRRVSHDYSSEVIPHMIFDGYALNQSTVLFRNTRELFYREKLRVCEDVDAWLRLLTLQKKMVVVSDVLAKYRIRASSVTSEHGSVHHYYFNTIRRWHEERVRSGSDSYDIFTPPDDLRAKNLNQLQLREEWARYGVYTGDADRRALITAIKKKGIIAGRRELLYYILSFFSFRTRRRLAGCMQKIGVYSLFRVIKQKIEY